MVTRTIQLAAVAVAAVLLGAVAAVSFAGSKTVASTDALTDVFALQHAYAAQVDYFLKIDGIDGESTHSSHGGEIEILSWSWGATNAGTFSGGGGGGAGQVSFSDISIVKTLDKSSPKLFMATAQGEHMREVILSGAALTTGKNDARSQDYYVITLSDVLVTSYQQSGSSGDIVPTESVSMNFSKIKVEYRPQNADGSLGDPVVAEWNVAENTGA